MELNSNDRLLPILNLGQYQSAVSLRLSKMEESHFISRFWNKDGRLWNLEEDSKSIKESMGWIKVVDKMVEKLPEINEFLEECLKNDIKNAVLLGMGGSSLVSIVFKRILKNKSKINFHIIDTTDPSTIKQIENQIDIKNTMFIVASKSGSTAEAMALFEYFYSKSEYIHGEQTGNYFTAITDPGTNLRTIAQQRHFKKVFVNFEDIGGRYSALTYFGLLPWVMMEQNASDLLKNAQKMAKKCSSEVIIYQNPGFLLGAAIGELARLGRNKLTLVIPESFSAFGIWLEQLIAESTGKNGIGILPIITTQLGASKFYGDDRIFVFFDLVKEQNENVKDKLSYFSKLGHPIINIPIESTMDLGGEFFKWEIATATACAILGINPFDQENVQKSKEITNKLLIAINQNKKLNTDISYIKDENLSFYSSHTADNSNLLIKNFLNHIKERDYIAIQAYITENKDIDNKLKDIKKLFQEKLNIATTIGYGPRYLHSTGQYHKGGPNNGVFLQFTSNEPDDTEIPGKPYTFRQLINAQALGDFTALLNDKKNILSVDLGNDILKGLNEFKMVLENVTKTDNYLLINGKSEKTKVTLS